MSSPAPPPPGWYADPWHVTTHRWWDGQSWTSWGWSAPTSTSLDPASPTFSPWGGLFVGIATVLTILAVRQLDEISDYRQTGVTTFVFYALLFGGMAGSCVAAARLFGSGSIVRDFGWRLRGIDIAWGFVLLIGSIVARVVFALIVGIDRGGPTEDLRDGLRDHHDVLAVFLVAALIGAPLFEELVFRGVIQRSLTKLAGKYVGVIGQGVLFGFYHVVGAFDLVSVFYVGSLSVIGIVLGIGADRTGRLGPGMIAHCMSNAVAMIVLLTY